MGSLLHESGSAYIDQPNHPHYIQHPVFIMEKGQTILNQYLKPDEEREEVLSKILKRIIDAKLQ
jgi:hypothetical protein